MIQFQNVSKSFGNIIALQDISFKVENGEFVFIVGPSGAGKTTILKLLLREFKPSSGEIFVDDVDITKIKKRDVPALRQKIGSVFQDFKLLPERTIRENIQVALAIKNINENEWKDIIDEVLKLVGLADRSELFPAQLSGGELQRASLARALVVNPIVIFADEPTGNLDLDTGKKIIDLLLKINQEGKTVIVTSHNESIIKRAGKRIIRLKNGRII
jgi:cell division transport system ATP-binding protein